MRFTLYLSLAASLSAAPAPVAPTVKDVWPEFRGPKGDGHADATGLPVRWNEKENIRWKTFIHGKGWSSPVVWGKQVWVTTAPKDGKELYAIAVDRDSGKVIHDLKVFDVPKPAFCIEFNSYASCTPAIEEGRVYVHFGSAGTACLDTRTGKTLWSRRDLPCDHWRGPASSPILFGNLLILTFDGYDHQYLAALDKRTGRTVWKTDRDIDYGTDNGDAKKAYGTPRVVTVDGKPQLISPSAGAAVAYDPKTGAELWRVRAGGMNVAARPLYGHGLVYLCTGDGGFKFYAVRPDGHGDVTKTHVKWKLGKNVPSRCGPVLVGDHIYMINEAGIVSCVDAKSGDSLWSERLKGHFSASPVVADGRLYFCNQEGITYVVPAGKAWKVLAANKLDDGFMASPAVAGKALFLRTKTHLYRIEKKD